MNDAKKYAHALTDAGKALIHTDWTGVLDVAIALPAEHTQKYVASVRKSHPHATAAQIAAVLAKNYKNWSGATSATVGAGAVFPGIGTAVSLGLTGVELAAFFSATAKYVFALAYLHGVVPETVEQRRALVLSSLMGDEGARLVADQMGITGLNWARKTLAATQASTLQVINGKIIKRLGNHLTKKWAGRAVGRFVPFGVGAAIGWFSGRSIAAKVIEGATAALGPINSGTTPRKY
ncbi:MAG: hypothetical protein Q4A71_08190 [Actinomycetaceae bacterium]|nr:hypothetical protein [Actinomycetaceae bacterium]